MSNDEDQQTYKVLHIHDVLYFPDSAHKESSTSIFLPHSKSRADHASLSANRLIHLVQMSHLDILSSLSNLYLWHGTHIDAVADPQIHNNTDDTDPLP